jgi:hypothetical protein
MIRLINVESKIFIINKYKISFFEQSGKNTRIVMQDGTSITVDININNIISYLKEQILISL